MSEMAAIAAGVLSVPVAIGLGSAFLNGVLVAMAPQQRPQPARTTVALATNATKSVYSR